jgi:hypothetical protein
LLTLTRQTDSIAATASRAIARRPFTDRLDGGEDGR